MDKVSIIIPVYNVEKMVGKCIDSILAQTYKNFELILINDGSKDKSLEILNSYKDDARVKVVDQSNRGAAQSRNRGIELSIGKYIMFIDSDDWIEPDFLNEYINAIQNTQYDIIMGGYRRVTNHKTIAVIRLKEGEFAEYVVTSPWAKLFRREYLIENDIKFLDTTSSEDVFFNVTAICKGAIIKIIPNIGYFWYYNENSLSNTLHKGFNQKVEILELLEQINFKNISNHELNEYYIIRYCMWYLLHSGKTASVESFLYEYHKLFSWLDKNIANHRKNKYLSIFKPKGEPIKFRTIIWVFDKLEKLHLIKLFAVVYCRPFKKI